MSENDVLGILGSIVLLGWPICGWTCGYLYLRPKGDDLFGFCLMVWCGAIVGYFGLFWLCTEEYQRRKKS